MWPRVVSLLLVLGLAACGPLTRPADAGTGGGVATGGGAATGGGTGGGVQTGGGAPTGGGSTGGGTADAGCACQAPLNATPVCADAGCDFTCQSGFHRCDQACAPDDDTSRCGASCAVCAASGGVPVCVAGACGVTCLAGFARCGSACVAETAQQCGPQCVACGAGSSCVAGACRATCTDGLVERGGACVDAQLLASGNFHTCVVHDGGVVCWGPGATGVLGRGGYDGGRLPGYAQLVDVGSVTAGDNSTCALLLDGGVRCWGSNTFGAVGNSGTLDQFTPSPVSLGATRVLVSGSIHACALLADAGAACWGSNLQGAVGGGPSQAQVVRSPATVPGAWVRLGAGDLQSFGLGADGGLFYWGYDLDLGGATSPTSLGWDAGLRTLARSPYHGCLIGDDGLLRCFGRGLEGQLGFVETDTLIKPLRVVPGLGRAVSVCVGDRYTCAAVKDGGVSCFGDNSYGQLGTGNATPSAAPVAVAGLAAATQVACHFHSTCAATVAGVSCWGDNALGQLGAPTPASSTTPIPVVLP